MVVDFLGSSKSVPRKECKKILKFFCDNYLHKKTANSLYVFLLFDKSSTRDDGVLGYCQGSDTNHRPKEFLIGIDPDLSKEETIKTIFHELIHLKQYSSGKLKDYLRKDRSNRSKWKSKIYLNNSLKIKDINNYPWEKEANRLENVIYEEYIDHVKKHRK